MAGYYERTEAFKAAMSKRAQKRSHGQVGTPAYRSWYAMKQRCLNPKNKEYQRYGGRGVTIDPRWLDFRNFFEDMGERPEGMTLDRIDGSKGYGPDNCRWATHSQQRLNQKRPGPSVPACHPDRKYVAKGMCDNCYRASRRT